MVKRFPAPLDDPLPICYSPPIAERAMRTSPRTDMAHSLADRYRKVTERVAAAAARAGVAPNRVIIVAVSKYADMGQVIELVRLGHQDFGESRVQQLVQRAAIADEMLHRGQTLPSVAGLAHAAPPDLRWHMIGHLQRNKVRKLLGCCRLIHSVDSLRLAEEIQAAAFKRDEPVEVLVQVNCSGERSKSGCAVPAALHLCEQIDTMIHLRVRGLMTMAAYSPDPERARPTFERCREVFDDIRRRGVGGESFNILSMGMSNDFEVALECGANMLRIGSAIFGEPSPAADYADDRDDDSSSSND